MRASQALPADADSGVLRAWRARADRTVQSLAASHERATLRPGQEACQSVQQQQRADTVRITGQAVAKGTAETLTLQITEASICMRRLYN